MKASEDASRIKNGAIRRKEEIIVSKAQEIAQKTLEQNADHITEVGFMMITAYIQGHADGQAASLDKLPEEAKREAS